MGQIRPVIIALFLILSSTACQTPRKSKKIATLQSLTSSDNSIADLPEIPGGENSAHLGYCLLDPASGEIVAQQNADHFFIPASTSKVPTTVAALKILGPDYRFKTYLSYRGVIKAGTLHGDIYLRGTGDPELKIPHWIDFLKRLAQSGIQRITGHFYYDESFFQPSPVIEIGREFWASYNSGVSALSLDFNQQRVRWFAQATGGSHAIYSFPEYPFVQFNLLRNTLTNETSFIFDDRQLGLDRWWLSETESQGGRQNLPIRRAALAAATIFVQLGSIAGLQLPDPEPGVQPPDAQVLRIHQSPPLVDLTNDVLEYSNNLVAELIQIAAARKLGGRAVGMAEAAEIVSQWSAKNLRMDQPYSFVNGSGLTTQNRITPAQLAAVLFFADQLALGERSYETLLPIAGYKGSLIDRLTLPGLTLRIRAKTGSMNYTSAIAGYLYARSGRRFIFAVMSTNFAERDRLDHLASLGLDADILPGVISPRPVPDDDLRRADSWERSAHSMEDRLLTQWIQKN